MQDIQRLINLLSSQIPDLYKDNGRCPIYLLTQHALKQNPHLFDKPILTTKEKEARKRYSHKWLENNRLTNAMSASMRNALRRYTNDGKKAGRNWESLVNYTLDDLIKHLESQFIEGMSWNNYGLWEIDHIMPISAFSFNSPDDIQFKLCWSLDNLRPLWKQDNRAKSSIVIKPKQFPML